MFYFAGKLIYKDWSCEFWSSHRRTDRQVCTGVLKRGCSPFNHTNQSKNCFCLMWLKQWHSHRRQLSRLTPSHGESYPNLSHFSNTITKRYAPAKFAGSFSQGYYMHVYCVIEGWKRKISRIYRVLVFSIPLMSWTYHAPGAGEIQIFLWFWDRFSILYLYNREWISNYPDYWPNLILINDMQGMWSKRHPVRDLSWIRHKT